MGNRCQTNYESMKQGCSLRARSFHFAKSIASRRLARFEHTCDKKTALRLHSKTEASIEIVPPMLAFPVSIVPEHALRAHSLSYSSSSADLAKVLWLLP